MKIKKEKLMKIQYIINSGIRKGYRDFSESGHQILFSDFSDMDSLDEFHLNIIDLNYIWECKKNSTQFDDIEFIKELKNLKLMIENSQKTKILFILPKNQDSYYNYSPGYERYSNFRKLEHYFNIYHSEIEKLFFPKLGQKVAYEKTKTKIDEIVILADFYYCDAEDKNILTKSYQSEKITTIKIDDSKYVTTLNFENLSKQSIKEFISEYSYIDREVLILFLENINIIEKQSSKIPDWVWDIDFFDDKEKKKL